MLNRRDFLRATLVTAGALLVPGCGDDDSDETSSTRTLTQDAAVFPQSVASGDPKPDSVILWTRVEDATAAGDLSVELEVATDQAFTQPLQLNNSGQAKIQVLKKFDHCVKVRVAGLSAATVYYFRFIYVKGNKNYVTRVGRTKTAPAKNADVAVRFAFVSCQDYIGRYYNAYALLAREDIDFFVHLGDYVYETTGDPTFQNTTGRKIVFTDTAGAIALGEGEKTYYAAKSVSNYRDLYKTYRSDPNAQAVHEKFPMIATWDDHEFSDDCHGATATYFDGKENETDVARRKAANQVWFEYQPVDFLDAPDFVYDPSKPFPGDISIWRDFVFGRHVHLVMTDLRSYRADHIIPEEAFPGTVVADQAALTAELGSAPDLAAPYVDIDTYQAGLYQQVLTAAAATAGFDPAAVTGNISVRFINAMVDKVNASLPPAQQIPPIDEAAQAAMERGYAYIDLGKGGFYTSIGSRYFVVLEPFQTVAAINYMESDKASEEVMGARQEAWFLSTLQQSTATWKVWGNEYCLSPLAIDLTGFPLPDAFKHRFLMTAEDWNGFQNKRSDLIEKLAAIGGVVAITGDIHAFFAGTPPSKDTTKKIVEIVGSSISSAPYKSLLQKQVATDPILSQIPTAPLLAANIDGLLLSTSSKINPYLGYAKSDANGYVLVQASGAELIATMNIIPEKEVFTDYSSKLGELSALVTKTRFRTIPGESELYQELGGVWKKWDPTTQGWV